VEKKDVKVKAFKQRSSYFLVTRTKITRNVTKEASRKKNTE